MCIASKKVCKAEEQLTDSAHIEFEIYVAWDLKYSFQRTVDMADSVKRKLLSLNF